MFAPTAVNQAGVESPVGLMSLTMVGPAAATCGVARRPATRARTSDRRKGRGVTIWGLRWGWSGRRKGGAPQAGERRGASVGAAGRPGLLLRRRVGAPVVDAAQHPQQVVCVTEGRTLPGLHDLGDARQSRAAPGRRQQPQQDRSVHRCPWARSILVSSAAVGRWPACPAPWVRSRCTMQDRRPTNVQRRVLLCQHPGISPQESNRMQLRDGRSLIARPRLLARIGEAQIVLLEAPGGYGKSTTARQLAAALDLPLVRAVLPDDRRRSRCLLRSLGAGGPARRSAGRSPTPSTSTTPRLPWRGWLARLAASRTASVLPVDDAQRATADAAAWLARLAGTAARAGSGWCWRVVGCGRAAAGLVDRDRGGGRWARTRCGMDPHEVAALLAATATTLDRRPERPSRGRPADRDGRVAGGRRPGGGPARIAGGHATDGAGRRRGACCGTSSTTCSQVRRAGGPSPIAAWGAAVAVRPVRGRCRGRSGRAGTAAGPWLARPVPPRRVG